MATQHQVDQLAQAIARNLGALEELRHLRSALLQRRMGDESDTSMHTWLTWTSAIKVIEARIDALEAEGRKLDTQLFAWMDADLAAMGARQP